MCAPDLHANRSGMSDSYIRDRGTRGTLEANISCFSLMERWVHTRAFASVLGPRGRASLDAPPHGAKSSLDDDVPTPRLGRGVEPVTGGTVSDASHPSLRCEPTMTIQRTSTPYVSGYGESAVPTLSASERSSIDVSERTLHHRGQTQTQTRKQSVGRIFYSLYCNHKS